MFGRLVSTMAGGAIARQVGGAAAGPLGMAAGVMLPMVLRRLGPLGMIGVAVGGYFVKRLVDRERARRGDVSGNAASAVPATAQSVE